MSFKQFLVLFFMFLVYLTLGAYMFYSIERPLEEDRRALAKAEALEIKELLKQHYAAGLPEEHLELLTRLSQYCGKSFYIHAIPTVQAISILGQNSSSTTLMYAEDDDENTDEDVEETAYQWTFYNALLFVIITISTIGYGNLTPSSHQGRMLDVLYALFGIPFAGIVLAQMADYYGRIFLRSHHRRKSHEYQTRLSLIFDILTYTGMGVVLFIFFPAAIFVYFENWTFDTAVYYAFITLTTIGYGDLVAGQKPDGTWSYDVYQAMVLVWVLFGLGYMLMIVGVLTRAMKSKKVRKIERKLAHTIKQTQSKIWNEFSQDVVYLRRMLNEMYLLKIQPVYIEKEREEDKEGIRRVKSCPNLTEWPVLSKILESDETSSEEDEEEMAAKFRSIAMTRREGKAENVMSPKVKKTVSEGDLSRIDRQATFGEDSLEPTLLLAKVVDALGTSIGSKFSLYAEEPPTRKTSAKLNGIHGFSDEEILASERTPSRWSLGGRKRTQSENKDHEKTVSEDESRTWGGVTPVDIQRFIKMRANGRLSRSSQVYDSGSVDSSSSRSSLSDPSLKAPQSRMRRMSLAVVNLFSQAGKSKSQEIKELRDSKKKRKSTNALPTIESNKRLSLPNNDLETPLSDQVNYLTHTSGRRGSVFAALATGLTPKDANIPVSPVLEQTSVADFLRLLTSLQARLDPNLLMPSENHSFPNPTHHRRKSLSNSHRETINTALTSILANSTVNGPHLTRSNMNHLQRSQRALGTEKTQNGFGAKGKQGRRFSLIPPMDVDHPSTQTNHKDVLKLRKRSSSSQNVLQSESGSNTNVSNPISRGSRRTSLSGTARYINAKFQGSLETLKSGVPNLNQGFRKFSVRPVSNPDLSPKPPETKPKPTVTIQAVPTITIDHCDSEPPGTNVDEKDDGLQDVVISRL